eukprot:3975-Heterococcus_DN1.PRE.2
MLAHCTVAALLYVYSRLLVYTSVHTCSLKDVSTVLLVRSFSLTAGRMHLNACSSMLIYVSADRPCGDAPTVFGFFV